MATILIWATILISWVRLTRIKIYTFKFHHKISIIPVELGRKLVRQQYILQRTTCFDLLRSKTKFVYKGHEVYGSRNKELNIDQERQPRLLEAWPWSQMASYRLLAVRH